MSVVFTRWGISFSAKTHYNLVLTKRFFLQNDLSDDLKKNSRGACYLFTTPRTSFLQRISINLFPLGSDLLFLALFVTYQILPSTRALPIDCQRNTAVCLEEIMKEVTQVRFEVKILTENKTLAKRKHDSSSFICVTTFIKIYSFQFLLLFFMSISTVIPLYFINS